MLCNCLELFFDSEVKVLHLLCITGEVYFQLRKSLYKSITIETEIVARDLYVSSMERMFTRVFTLIIGNKIKQHLMNTFICE